MTPSAGSLDPTFGIGGVQFDPSAFLPSDVAVQVDGKIVVVGSSNSDTTSTDFLLTRYNLDGSRDVSFGTAGRVTTDFASFADAAKSVAIQADGKIVVAGSSDSVAFSSTGRDFALARYNPDGSLDTTFGNGGKITTSFGVNTADVGEAVVLQADGKIVVVGASVHFVGAGNFTDFALVRYHSDGSLDTSFGTDGKVITDFGTFRDQASAVALEGDGKIVVAGAANAHFALARYDPDGGLDLTFGTAGKLTTDFRTGDLPAGIAFQADGKIVLVGTAARFNGTFYQEDFALTRYNNDGSLDTSFGTDGKVFTDFSVVDLVSDVAVQADGKIVVVGGSYGGVSTDFDFALARYNLDGSFGNGGKVTSDLGSTTDVVSSEYAGAIALQADGKMVVVGYHSLFNYFTNADGELDVNTISQDFALVRYLGGASAQGQIEPIIRDVQALVAVGVLNYGNGNSLLVKLEHAIQRLDAGNVTAAVNSLQAFINEVNAFIDTGKLTTAQGQPMIDLAQAVIDQLNGGLP